MYIAITSRNYASRYLYSAEGGAGGAGGHRGVLSVLQKETTDRFADVSLTAGPNGLNGKLAPILKMLCNEFNDLKSLDKIAGVQAKVDAVTGVMKENMALAMRNNDRCAAFGFLGGAAAAVARARPGLAHPCSPSPRPRPARAPRAASRTLTPRPATWPRAPRSSPLPRRRSEMPSGGSSSSASCATPRALRGRTSLSRRALSLLFRPPSAHRCYAMIAIVVIAVLGAIIAYFVNANKKD